MADTVFRFAGVPNRYPDVVQRIAVLYPLRGRANGDASVRTKTAELIDQWRARIGELTPFNYLNASKNLYAVRYARNCLPTFVMTGPVTRVCNNRQICPFCYARRVRALWEHIDGHCVTPAEDMTDGDGYSRNELRRRVVLHSAPQPQQPRRSQSQQYQLIERHHTFFRDVPDEPDVEVHLAALLDSIADTRSRIVKLLDPLAAFCFTSVEPYTNGQQWRIRHRQLFKTAVGYELPASLVDATCGSIAYHTTPTRSIIMRTVARVCAYPKGLMTGNALRTTQLLRVRTALRFKSAATFRGFRDST